MSSVGYAAALPARGPVLSLGDMPFVLGWALAGIALVMAAGFVMSVQSWAAEPGDAFLILCRWDCGWYLEIATDGYYERAWRWPTGDGTNWAFFPALPTLVRLAMDVTGLEPRPAGFLVAFLFHVGAVALFLAYARDLVGEAAGRFATVLFAVWPFGIHAMIPMSEAIFVPMFLGALVFARRDRWIVAALFAAAVSASRPTGFLVVLPLLMIAARQHGFWRVVTLRPGTEPAFLALAASGVGLALFMIHLHAVTGHALAFTHAQVAWHREMKWPWMTVIDVLNPLTLEFDWIVYNAFNLAAAALAGWLGWRLWKMDLKPEATFVFVTLAIGLLAGQSTSLPRFSGSLAPLVLAVAAMVAPRPAPRAVAVAVCAVLLVAASAAWAWQSYFVM